MDPVKLLAGTAGPVGAVDNKEVELTLMGPLSKFWSTLLVIKSSVVELACLTLEPVRLASRTVPPEVRMMEVASVVAATLTTILVLS